MKDKIHQELSKGDIVIYNSQSFEYLTFGKVLSIASKMVKIKPLNQEHSRNNVKYPKHIIKINDQAKIDNLLDKDRAHQKFCKGDHVTFVYNHYGELFTGKIKNMGKYGLVKITTDGGFGDYFKQKREMIKINDQMKMAKNESPEFYI